MNAIWPTVWNAFDTPSNAFMLFPTQLEMTRNMFETGLFYAQADGYWNLLGKQKQTNKKNNLSTCLEWWAGGISPTHWPCQIWLTHMRQPCRASWEIVELTSGCIASPMLPAETTDGENTIVLPYQMKSGLSLNYYYLFSNSGKHRVILLYSCFHSWHFVTWNIIGYFHFNKNACASPQSRSRKHHLWFIE